MARTPKYSDEELLDEIRRLAEKLDREPPRKKDMAEYGQHNHRTYRDRWGTWNAAVEAAGFEPRSKGTNYTERPDVCPVCGREESGLDFHHWRYGEDEIGCYLCRECHDEVHEGKANTRNVAWLVPCIENLVEMHIANHEQHPSPKTILSRYNLPDVEDIVEKAIEEYSGE
jgi:hypothetical protein